MNEASLYSHNCFITLTYSDEHLPLGGSLVKSDYQNFLKRLRNYLPPGMLRYYMCGEYGSEWDANGVAIPGSIGRPHYHMILFNHDFDDKIHLTNRGDNPLYISETLQKLWKDQGYTSVGSVTFESAAYVARYLMKKLNGDRAEEINPETGLKHYERTDIRTGEIIELTPEFTNMSRAAGIGADWYEEYKQDLVRDDCGIQDGRRIPLPSYYRNKFDTDFPETAQILKENRIRMAQGNPHNTPARLEERERCKQAQLDQLRRSL